MKPILIRIGWALPGQALLLLIWGAITHFAGGMAGLFAPENALRLEPLCITVDRAGVISDQCPIDRPGIDSINFQQIVARDRRRYIVRCVKFNRADALAAVEAVKEVQSRYLII